MYVLPEDPPVKLLEYKQNNKNTEIVKKTAVKLQEYREYIQKKIENNEISVFSLEKFPTNTNNYNFTPKDVYNSLIEYSESTEGLETILKKRGITRNTFYLLCDHYTEIKTLYEQGFYRKADSYEDQAANLYNQDIPDYCWKETKWGKEINFAGIKYLDNKFNGALRLAAIHNREVYGDKTQIDQRSLNVNVNANINTQANTNNSQIDQDLINNLFTGGRKIR